MATKGKRRLTCKSLAPANMPDDYSDGSTGMWSPEFQTWMHAKTLKGLFFTDDWVFIIVDLIAREISNLPRHVVRVLKQPDGTEKTEIADKHPLEALLQQPNKYMSGVNYRYLETLEHTLMGNAILWHARTINELHIIPADDAQIMFGQDGKPMAYQYLPGGYDESGIIVNTAQYNLPVADILHVRRPNPASVLWGLSPFVPARNSILFNRYSSEYLNAFYIKGASPSGAIELDRDAAQDAIARLQKSFEMAYSGRRNMRRTMVLPKGTKYVPIGSTIADQRLVDVIRLNRETIIAVLHVPKHAVGLQETGSLGSEEHKQALKYFWQSTILPIDSAINGEYNRFFKQQLGEGYRIESDLTAVQILQDDEAKKAELAEKMLKTHTVNEVRAQVYGLPPIPGGDVLLELLKLSKAQAMAPQPAQQQPDQQEEQPAPKTPDTEEQALAGGEAKAAGERERYAKINFQPSKTMAAAAQRGLKWREEYARGGTKEDVATAQRIAAREALTPKEVRRASMALARHRLALENTLEDGAPANGKILAHLFGGTAGLAWHATTAKAMDAADKAAGLQLSETPDLQDLADVEGHGSHPGDDFVKAMSEKYGGPEQLKARDTAEDSAVPEFAKRASQLLVDQFNAAMPVVVDALRGKKDFDPPKAPDEEPRQASIKRLRRELQEALQTLAGPWSEDYEKALQATLDAGYDSQLKLSMYTEARDAIEALRERDADGVRKQLRARGLDSFAKISATTSDQILDVVQAGLEDMRTIRQIVQDVADQFRSVGPNRADVIARTEVLTSYSLGQMAMARHAKEAGLDVIKVWVNVGDKRVRGRKDGKYPNAEFDHWEMQGKTAPLDKAFENGLMFPRDPSGEPGNIIQCRCTMLTVPKDELRNVRVPKE